MTRGGGYRAAERLAVLLRYAGLLAVALLTVGPFAWLVVTALKSGAENLFAYPPVLLPEQPTLENFAAVWQAVPFARYALNSTVVAGLTVALEVLFCALAAYPLARMRFKGRNTVFFLVLATMMVPFPVVMVPLFILVAKLDAGVAAFAPGLVAQPYFAYLWLVLPASAGAFGIFLLRQAFQAVPVELEEAVILDGGSAWTFFSRVLLPLSKPALASLAIFGFVGAWGDFLWPLLILQDPETYTLPLGVANLAGTFSANWRLIAAGAVLSILPVLAVFLLLQRHFVSGAAAGAVKG